MSSFGSCGSTAGAVVDRAAGTLSKPQPASSSNPAAPMSVADQRIRENRCVTSWSGPPVPAQAAAPATSGAEKLVPSPAAYPDGLAHVGTASGMFSPGAARSTASERFEKDEEWLAASVAATVRT